MTEVAAKKSRRSISDKEIALIRTMLRRGMDKTTIQSYFTHPDRPVNYGRITNIEQGAYGRRNWRRLPAADRRYRPLPARPKFPEHQ